MQNTWPNLRLIYYLRLTPRARPARASSGALIIAREASRPTRGTQKKCANVVPATSDRSHLPLNDLQYRTYRPGPSHKPTHLLPHPRISLPTGHRIASPPGPRARRTARARAMSCNPISRSRLGRQISRSDSGIPLLRTVKQSPSPNAPKSAAHSWVDLASHTAFCPASGSGTCLAVSRPRKSES